MTREEWVREIAREYVRFERRNRGARLQPLNRDFALTVGSGFVQSGRYRPGGDPDYHGAAREAQRVLPAARLLPDDHPTGATDDEE